MVETPDIVAKRCVVFFGGYEHVSVAQQRARFVREIRRFEETWNVKATFSESDDKDGDRVRVWPIVSEGPNWRVETRFHYFAWNDLIEEDFDRPDWKSVPAGLVALFDFILTGTAFRYLFVAWRYWFFALYPFVLSAAFAIIAAAVVSSLPSIGVSTPWYVAVPLGIVVFWALLRWPGDRLQLRYMLNDWSFASAIAWGRRRSYTKRIDVFADALAKAIGRNGDDEVLIVGHSLGAVLAVESLAAAMERSPDLARPERRVTLMTVGSSLLKVALHPAARRLRKAIGKVLSDNGIAWIDYSALVDPLNFYRTDPGRALGLAARRSPILRTVKIRTMLGEMAYKRFKRNFLRLHRQFVMGNSQRYHYDFFMSCCGPMAQADRIDNPTLSVESFGEDGSYQPIADGAGNGSRAHAATAR